LTKNPSTSTPVLRRFLDRFMTALIGLSVILALVPLVLIVADVVYQGASVVNLSFLTNTPTPPTVPGGGIGPAIQGSVVMVGLGALIAVPIGVGAGIFFSEWPESRVSTISSFTNDVLAEFPSIVIGIFVYVLLVLVTRSFSAIAGAVALAIIMIPIIARTTEESLKIVPSTLREASMALGISRWKTVLRIVISTGRNGLATGILLAIARAAGETAPLLLTALGGIYYITNLNQPTPALPLLIFNYATSPYPLWIEQAWGAALVLVVFMLALNLTVKLVIGRKFSEIRAEI
jgi:phosphate transport system permease protein